MSQSLVDQYFTRWIDVAVYNTENYQRGPSSLILSFNNRVNATRSYEFLREWKKWNEHQPLTMSIIKEEGHLYSIYLFKEGRSEFVKGTFNIRKEDFREFEKFLSNEAARTYVLLPRFIDKAGRIDSYTKDVILQKGFRYRSRTNLQEEDFEFSR